MNGINTINDVTTWRSSIQNFYNQAVSSVPLADLRAALNKLTQQAEDSTGLYMDIVFSLSEILLNPDFELPTTDQLVNNEDVQLTNFDPKNLRDMIDKYGQEFTEPLFAPSSSNIVACQFTLASGHVLYLWEGRYTAGSATLGTAFYLALTAKNAQNDGVSVISTGILAHKLKYATKWFAHYNLFPGTVIDETYFSLYDLVDQLQAQLDVKGYISDIAGGLLNATLDLTAINQVYSEAMQTLHAADVENSARIVMAREFFNNVTEGWKGNGIKGAISAMLRWTAAISDLTTDENGCLTFSSNADYAPSLYIAGILNSALQLFSGIISSIFAIFGGIVGKVLSVIGSGVLLAVDKVSNDWRTKTTAGINISDSVPFPWSPLTCFKIDNLRLDASSPIGRRLINQGYAVVEAVTGYGLIGLAAPYSGGAWVSARMEIHPSFVDYRKPIWYAMSGLYAIAEETLPLRFTWTRLQETISASALVARLRSGLDQNMDTTILVNDPSTGVLSQSDDKIFRSIICSNMGFTLLWLHCFFNPALTFTLPNFFFSGVNWGGFTTAGSDSVVSECLAYMSTARPANGCFSWNDITSSNIFNRLDDDHQFEIEEYLDPGFGSNMLPARGDILSLPNGAQFGHTVPNFDATSFWLIVGLTTAVAAVTAVVTVKLALKARKTILKARARSAAKVEKAWSQAVSSPTGENVDAYYKAVRKANALRWVIGGPRYDAGSYWVTGSASAPTINSTASGLVSKALESSSSVTLESLQRLIAG